MDLANPESSLAVVSLIGSYILILSMVIILLIIVCVIGYWKIFEKAGIPGWWAVIPIANCYKATELFIGNGWFFLLLLIPYVNYAFTAFLQYKIGKAFNKSIPFIICSIFFAPITNLLIGFGPDEYLGNE